MALSPPRRGYPIGLWQLDDARSGRPAVQKPQRLQNHLPLPRHITGRTQRSTHWVPGHHHSRHFHVLGHVTEGTNKHGDGGDTLVLKRSCEVSHGHVTHRSDRY